MGKLFRSHSLVRELDFTLESYREAETYPQTGTYRHWLVKPFADVGWVAHLGLAF
jgi:hypothetical protein